MMSLPQWRRDVRDAILARLKVLGYSVVPVSDDAWVVRPMGCDADMPMVRGAGALAAVLYAAEVLHANRNTRPTTPDSQER